MFARKLEFDIKLDKKTEFLRKVREEVIPTLKKQTGFLDILGLMNDIREEKVLIISLWTKKLDVERYEREVFPKITEMVKPYLMTPITVTTYNVETTISEHFVAAVA